MNFPASRSTSTSQPHAAVARAVAIGLIAGGSLLTMAGAADAPSTALQAGPLQLQFNGFTALEGVYRSKNQSADIGSSFNGGIPFAYQTNAHLTEFRESARQSRFALLAKGPKGDGWQAEGYFETDFLSAGVTSNSNESNSYTLRVRHFYGVLNNLDSGWYLLGGQTWSLVTLDGKGITPRTEVTPATIDAQYATGFDWTRSPQLRLVKNLGSTAAVGISLESPQAQFTHANGALVTNSGGSLLNSGANYAIDFAPDVVVKAAFDPSFGHYEIYGLARGFRDRYPATAAGTNHTTWGGGIGGGAILPVTSELSIQLSGLTGSGIGRYGTSGLPDVTVKPDGTPAAISEVDALAGLTYKPTSTLSIYAYAGLEQASQKAYVSSTGAGLGYGSPLYSNSGCDSLTGTAATCAGDTRRIEQFDLGEWWKAYQGVIGNFQIGLQYSYTKRQLFADSAGNAPSANVSMFFTSFRYYPYQR